MGKRPCSTRVRFSRAATGVASVVIRSQTRVSGERSMLKPAGATSVLSHGEVRGGVIGQLCRRPIAAAQLGDRRVEVHDVRGVRRVRENAEGMPELVGCRERQTLVNAGTRRVESRVDEDPNRYL